MRFHTKSIPQLWAQHCILACFHLWPHLFTSTRDQGVESIRELFSYFTFPPSLPSHCICLSWTPPPTLDLTPTLNFAWTSREQAKANTRKRQGILSIPMRPLDAFGRFPSYVSLPQTLKYSIFSLERCSGLSATHAATIARNGPYLRS